MEIAMSGVRSSQPSLPAITGRLEPTLARQHHDDRSHIGAWEHASQTSEWARRSINLVLALVALVVALPVMILVGFLVRLTSRGPVLYTQVRSGSIGDGR